MALPRQKFRELVFQLLYCNDLLRLDHDDFVGFMMEILKTTRRNVKEAYEKVLKIESEISFLNAKIAEFSVSYDIGRISKVELSVLRLGFYEMFFDKEIPHKIILAEAIRLCNKFGGKNSSKFINAVLDGGLRLLTN